VEAVNNHINRTQYGGVRYAVGYQLICRSSNIKVGGKRMFLNYTYTIVSMGEKEFVLADGDTQFTVKKATVDKYFILPHARTCHAYQGLSEDEPITIFDREDEFADPEWIYTAITRTTRLENIAIYIGKKPTRDLRIEIGKRIQSHKTTDSTQGKSVVGDYITIDWVMKRLRTRKSCERCGEYLDSSGGMNAWSIDRRDNELGHTQSNCRIVCLHCNVSIK
jgi:hypothetical protein